MKALENIPAFIQQLKKSNSLVDTGVMVDTALWSVPVKVQYDTENHQLLFIGLAEQDFYVKSWNVLEVLDGIRAFYDTCMENEEFAQFNEGSTYLAEVWRVDKSNTLATMKGSDIEIDILRCL